MAFEVAASYTLDALNFLNVLTRDEFYVKRHREDAERFQAFHTERNQRLMAELVRLNGRTMLSPFLTLVVSAVPGFDSMDLIELLQSPDLLKHHYSQTPYYDEEDWEENKPLFALLPEIIGSLEHIGFKDHWHKHKQPYLLQKGEEIAAFSSRYSVFAEINQMLGPASKIDQIVLYLCSYAAPHGIKIAGPRYISDVSFTMEFTLGVSIHEMFHPPYRIGELDPLFSRLLLAPVLLAAFDKQKERYGYSTMEGFIEENVVEAMSLFIWEKIGLEKDPYAYLKKHDEGSHLLSFLLLSHLQCQPKAETASFTDYFNRFLGTLPYGQLEEELSRFL